MKFRILILHNENVSPTKLHLNFLPSTSCSTIATFKKSLSTECEGKDPDMVDYVNPESWRIEAGLVSDEIYP